MRSTRPQQSRSVCSGNPVLYARKYGFVGCFGRCEQLLVATRSSFPKGALQNDICRFESSMPSHAVRSPLCNFRNLGEPPTFPRVRQARPGLQQRPHWLASLLGRSVSSTSDVLRSIGVCGCRSQGPRFSSGWALLALPGWNQEDAADQSGQRASRQTWRQHKPANGLASSIVPAGHRSLSRYRQSSTARAWEAISTKCAGAL